MRSEHVSDNRFLIIDSYPFGRDTLRRALVSIGARSVDTAVNANNAIALCQDVDYDMVLSDYDLGDGKNGQQLLEELRARKLLKNSSAFIVLTAQTTREVVLNTLEFQPDDYLAKPYVQKLLIQRVKRMLFYKYQLRDAFHAIDNGNVPAAIEACEAHLHTKDSFRSRCLRLLADLYYSNNQFDQAQKIYDDELIDNDSDWARMGMANVCLQLGRLDEAEVLYSQLISTNYMYVEAYEHLASIYQAQQEYIKAESTIRRAVSVSPLSLRKQKVYAQLCEKNNNFEAAAQAWRQIIRITKNSKNESVENHLNLTRCLADFCEHNKKYNHKDVVPEIMNNLQILRQRYHVYGDKELQSLLIEGRVQFGRGEESLAKENMKAADILYREDPDSYSDQAHLEFAKSLLVNGDDKRAQEMLTKLAADSKDPDILSKADKILDEPVSKDGKKRIIKLNRKGISYFKRKDFVNAVQAFRLAQASFPRNVELNLNLIQALLKSVQSVKNDSDKTKLLAEAQQCLYMINSITPQHKKYKNYEKLSSEIENLQNEDAA